MLWVKELEPWAENYTEIYSKAGSDKILIKNYKYWFATF